MNTKIEALQTEINRIVPDVGMIVSTDPINGKILLSSFDEPNSFEEIPQPDVALFRLKDIPFTTGDSEYFVVEQVYCTLVNLYAYT
jgi:hypothetical protein